MYIHVDAYTNCSLEISTFKIDFFNSLAFVYIWYLSLGECAGSLTFLFYRHFTERSEVQYLD